MKCRNSPPRFFSTLFSFQMIKNSVPNTAVHHLKIVILSKMCSKIPVGVATIWFLKNIWMIELRKRTEKVCPNTIMKYPHIIYSPKQLSFGHQISYWQLLSSLSFWTSHSTFLHFCSHKLFDHFCSHKLFSTTDI